MRYISGETYYELTCNRLYCFSQNSWFDLKNFILLLYETDTFFKVWIHTTITWYYFESCIAVKHYYVYFLANISEFSCAHNAISLIIIDFILQSCWYYWKFLDLNITLMQNGLEQTFCSSFAMWEQIFIKDIKLVAQKNIKIMKTCCIVVMSKLRVVLQMCLQTISSILSSDGHLKPTRVCQFNLGSLHIIMNIVITLWVAGLCYLTVGMNHISEQLNEYLLKTIKTGLKHNQFQWVWFRIKNEIAKITIQSKMFEANLLMKGRIWKAWKMDILCTPII